MLLVIYMDSIMIQVNGVVKEILVFILEEQQKNLKLLENISLKHLNIKFQE